MSFFSLHFKTVFYSLVNGWQKAETWLKAELTAEGGNVVDNMSAPGRTHMRLPLNLTRITAGQLRRLGLALGITISGSINDQRLVVEDKLSDEGHDPCNIQVVFEGYSSEAAFVLCDEKGEFLTVPVAASTTEVTPEVIVRESEHSSEESGDEPDEIETLRQTVEDITTERDTLQAQLLYKKLCKHLNRRRFASRNCGR